jgi:hypothetical protein
MQSLTSAYHAGNVAKGGIFLQLCGWLGTHELNPGAMIDLEYLNETKFSRSSSNSRMGIEANHSVIKLTVDLELALLLGSKVNFSATKLYKMLQKVYS